MSIHDAMISACRAVGIEVPRKVEPGRWCPSPVEGKGRSNTSGRVMINDDGVTGVAWNHSTGAHQRFWVGGSSETPPPVQRDPEADRRRAAEHREVEAACLRIVNACDQTQHPYLARKGFADEMGLVIADPRPLMPRGSLGEAMAAALPDGDGQLLVVPGRIGQRLTTVQFITADGAKKNILRGQMGGSCHRISTGRETWVCEGIATAMTVRAALRLLGRSVTVLSAFSASNVAKVAEGIPGALIAADHDKPIPDFGGLGTGEFYARRTGRKWAMPQAMGDWNDLHQAEGLRAVAIHLREFLL